MISNVKLEYIAKCILQWDFINSDSGSASSLICNLTLPYTRDEVISSAARDHDKAVGQQ